jgi:hypothetical protein
MRHRAEIECECSVCSSVRNETMCFAQHRTGLVKIPPVKIVLLFQKVKKISPKNSSKKFRVLNRSHLPSTGPCPFPRKCFYPFQGVLTAFRTICKINDSKLKFVEFFWITIVQKTKSFSGNKKTCSTAQIETKSQDRWITSSRLVKER